MFAPQVRQNPLEPQPELAGLPFSTFQQQAQLGHLHRLCVDIHAEDVVQQGCASLRGWMETASRRPSPGESAASAASAIWAGSWSSTTPHASSAGTGTRPARERPRPAGRVHDLQFGRFFGRFPLQQLPHRMFHDVVHVLIILRVCTNAARLADLRLLSSTLARVLPPPSAG